MSQSWCNMVNFSPSKQSFQHSFESTEVCESHCQTVHRAKNRVSGSWLLQLLESDTFESGLFGKVNYKMTCTQTLHAQPC